MLWFIKLIVGLSAVAACVLVAFVTLVVAHHAYLQTEQRRSLSEDDVRRLVDEYLNSLNAEVVRAKLAVPSTLDLERALQRQRNATLTYLQQNFAKPPYGS